MKPTLIKREDKARVTGIILSRICCPLLDFKTLDLGVFSFCSFTNIFTHNLSRFSCSTIQNDAEMRTLKLYARITLSCRWHVDVKSGEANLSQSFQDLQSLTLFTWNKTTRQWDYFVLEKVITLAHIITEIIVFNLCFWLSKVF